ncbi:MAG: hypothetical protein ACOCYR_07510 [Erythrobacter sp.]|uniref:hypothetical protein n=1 Tax=Erythrobacter sp. HL-111 TaxID=1798193 RepID=UPI0006DBC097|nr:hypothetical protein [Erythrobacter sp. HL-111]KPP93224.1 MAG: hypothetical protein HLUCCO15_06720 [Erythrobacteraceae bacterium HL-111]SDR91390.1 hypothetical protein SAMN04515621_0619 [Erythrobacter sp. HL-111]
MTCTSTGPTAELIDVALVLTDCLVRLDRAGAGIAAIHVNAAIEHLAAGLGAQAGAEPPGGDAAPAWDLSGEDADWPEQYDARLVGILPPNGQPH